MTLFDDQFNRALEIYQESGPRRRIAVQTRWKQAFPDAQTTDLIEWERAFREIERFAYDLAVQVLNKELSEDSARRRIAEQFPQLSRARAMTAFGQASYSAWK
jgi:hypothetical protein